MECCTFMGEVDCHEISGGEVFKNYSVQARPHQLIHSKGYIYGLDESNTAFAISLQHS